MATLPNIKKLLGRENYKQKQLKRPRQGYKEHLKC